MLRGWLIAGTVAVVWGAADAIAQEVPAQASADQPAMEPLWPAGAPGALGDEPADKPSITFHSPPKDAASGAAMLVCPGGGYGGLALDHEGAQIARWLNGLGIAAAVLRYRHAPAYRHPIPLGDAQRAMRLLRATSTQRNIDPARIGAMGFSAGGHLASTLGTHFDAGNPQAPDPLDRPGCRPDLLVLCYPVVALATSYAHAGSRRNLLGDDPDPAVLASLSNEEQVTPHTPPTFLFHTTTDTVVVPENSVLFYLALRKAGVAAELHVFAEGRHGVGLATDNEALRPWPALCAAWLKSRGFCDRP